MESQRKSKRTDRMIFKRVREYVSHPYEHPGEGKLVRKLGMYFLLYHMK